MIGIDTNVLVRYIMQDDPKQSARATRLIEGLTSDRPGVVPLVTVVELVSVLSFSCGLTRRGAEPGPFPAAGGRHRPHKPAPSSPER